MEKLKEEYDRYCELLKAREFFLNILLTAKVENKEYKEEVKKVEEELAHYNTVLIKKFGEYLKTRDQELKDFFNSKVTTLKVGYTRVNVRKKAKEEHTSTNDSADPNVLVESSNGLPLLPPDWKEYRQVDQNYEPMIDSHDAFIQLMERKKVQIIPLVEVSFSRGPQRIKKKIKVETVKKEELSKTRKKLANLDKKLLLFYEKASYQIVSHAVNLRDNTCYKINEKLGKVCDIPKSLARKIKNLFVDKEEREELKNQISEVKVRKRALKGTNKGYVMMGMLTTGIVIIIAATIFMIINNALNH